MTQVELTRVESGRSSFFRTADSNFFSEMSVIPSDIHVELVNSWNDELP